MALSELLTDSTTKTRLGAEALAELRANLWLVDCQTCGRPFGRREKPALAVQAMDDVAFASLHHRGCQSPRWLEYPPGAEREITPFPHASWWAQLLRMPGDMLVFLINPYYECATLSRADGRWQVTTLDIFAGYGMGTNQFDSVIVRPSLSVVVDDERISAHISHDGAIVHSWHSSTLTPDFRQAVEAKERITIGVTTSLDLREPIRDNPLVGLIAARQVRLGAATITYTDAAQLLRKSDFDENTRVRWLAWSHAAIKLGLGIEVGKDLPIAALACGYGDNTLITQLPGRDKLVSALMVAFPYAFQSRTPTDHRPVLGGGVHVMTADPASVAECFEMFTAVAKSADTTVARLATEPTAEQRKTEYLADIVIGMPEQFHAAYAFYRDDADDWGLHETRGHLAMTIGVDVRHRAGELIRRYPRVAVI